MLDMAVKRGLVSAEAMAQHIAERVDCSWDTAKADTMFVFYR